MTWLDRLRGDGVDVPVRIGIPGPTSVVSLLKFAARCGVGASSAVLTKYGVSLGRLLGAATPDRLVSRLVEHVETEPPGAVKAHLYPFGGIDRAAGWVKDFAARRIAA